MIGGNTPRSLHDPHLVPLHPSRKPFATLPRNTDERLVQDTISLQDYNPTILWPVRSFERRRQFQTIQNRYCQQILYGCSNSHCETPTCLSRQKRVSKGPFRPYTVLSARALATHLASESDPEKGLCPHQPISPGENSIQRAYSFSSNGKQKKRTPSSVERSSRSPRQSHHHCSTEPGTRKLSVTIDGAKAHTANGHVISPEVEWSHTDLKDDLECTKASEQRRPTKKDPKSFIQNLFDTTAMQLLQLAKLPETYLMWTQSNGDNQQTNSNSEHRDTNGTTNPAPIDRHVEETESAAQACFKQKMEHEVSLLIDTAPDKSTSRLLSTTSMPIDDNCPDSYQFTAEKQDVAGMESTVSQSHVDKSIEPIQHPQALCCFNRNNVNALFDTLNASRRSSNDEIYLLEDMGRTHACRFDGRASYPHNAEDFENLLAFSVQSITYVLSNIEPLLQSFLSEHSREHGLRMVSVDSFESMSEVFGLLSRLDVHPRGILPSLWVSAGKLYLPGIARFNAPAKEGGRLGKQRYSTNLLSTPRLESQECLGSLETCHIAKIILAALVGSIPQCDDGMWPAIRKLRASGRVVPSSSVTNSLTDHKADELITTVHAFEDEMALSLLLRLLRSLAGRHYITDMLQDQSLEQRKNDIGHDYPFTFQCFVRYVTCEGPKLHVADREIHPTLKGVGFDKLGQLQVAGNRHVPLFSLIEWLRTVILKEWDGKAEVLKCSATGAALELLKEIFNERFAGVEYDLFYTPFLAERLDIMDVPVEWATSATKMSSVHLLSYPFLFPPSVLISYFRAINYAAMYKAVETSVEAYNLAHRVTFAYDATRPGAIRLQERLDVAQKSYLVLEIRRGHVLVDAMDQTWRRQKRELMRPLKVQLGINEGEEGIDHGGVQQEFFRVAIAEALDPDYGAFITDSQSQMSWFHPCSLEPEYKFELLGLLTSLAIYNGLTLPFNFPRALYLKLLDIPVTSLHDIEDGWPELAKGLKILRDWDGDDVQDVFSRPYVFSVENFGTTMDWNMDELGKHMLMLKRGIEMQSQIEEHKIVARELHIPAIEQELIARTREMSTSERNIYLNKVIRENQDIPHEPVMVTNANRNRYIRDYIHYLVNQTVLKPFAAFRRGFYTCLNSKSLNLFTADQLKALVEGLPDIDVNDLQDVTRYEGGYEEFHPTIFMFWSVVHSWPQAKVRQLLEFVTASDRLPVGGMERVTFVIQKNGVGDARLPTSLTCYGRLLLPEYDDEEKLRKGLECAIENSKGFGTP